MKRLCELGKGTNQLRREGGRGGGPPRSPSQADSRGLSVDLASGIEISPPGQRMEATQLTE